MKCSAGWGTELSSDFSFLLLNTITQPKVTRKKPLTQPLETKTEKNANWKNGFFMKKTQETETTLINILREVRKDSVHKTQTVYYFKIKWENQQSWQGGWRRTEEFCFLLLFSHSVVSSALRPLRLQHARLPCPSPSPGACSNSCPLNQWCHPTISSSVVPFSSCPQSSPHQGLFQWVGSSYQSIVSQSSGASASASVLSMNIQGWFPLGLTGLISLLSKRLSRVISSTTVQKPNSSASYNGGLI